MLKYYKNMQNYTSNEKMCKPSVLNVLAMARGQGQAQAQAQVFFFAKYSLGLDL